MKSKNTYWLLALAGWLMPSHTVHAATPETGTVSESAPSVTWTGGPFATSNGGTCSPATTDTDPACDNFYLTVETPIF